MIQTNIKDIDKLLPYLNANLQKALQYIAATDFTKLPNGEVEVEGRTIFARINTYDTEPKADRKSEKHNDYIDVQFVSQGEETVWYIPLHEGCVLSEDKFAENDVAFYKNAGEINCVNLKAGDLAIFFPWEIHRPNCRTGAEPYFVQKIVVKVLAE